MRPVSLLKIAVVAITYRTLNNIQPVLAKLIHDGARCEVIWAPTSQRIESQSPRDFGLHVGREFKDLKPSDARQMQVVEGECRAYLEEFQPDLVLSDDMTNWPNRIVYAVVQSLPNRPFHLAWQHGLHQPWYALRAAFDADFFFCYGRMHQWMMGEANLGRVLPAGLPKLDSLAQQKTVDEGYISWFAQPAPDVDKQIELLTGIHKATKMPVRIRPHPAAPHAFSEAASLTESGLQIEDPALDPVDTLSRCHGFISTHSSAILEALLLGKSAVLFPSFGLTSFAGYPNIASDFTANAYVSAIKQYMVRQSATRGFLDDFIGGNRFDHTARTTAALMLLADFRARGLSPADIQAIGSPYAHDLMKAIA